MPPDNPAKITIKRRERDAVLQALQAGLVPRQGLYLIQVGRKAEISALISDLDRIAEGGAAFRLVAGRFGSGKTFFLSLLRSLALQKGLVVAQADFNMERRLYSADGHGRALYSELMGNLCLRAQPDGGALPTVLASWVSKIQYELMNAGGDRRRSMRGWRLIYAIYRAWSVGLNSPRSFASSTGPTGRTKKSRPARSDG